MLKITTIHWHWVWGEQHHKLLMCDDPTKWWINKLVSDDPIEDISVYDLPVSFCQTFCSVIWKYETLTLDKSFRQLKNDEIFAWDETLKSDENF